MLRGDSVQAFCFGDGDGDCIIVYCWGGGAALFVFALDGRAGALVPTAGRGDGWLEVIFRFMFVHHCVCISCFI